MIQKKEIVMAYLAGVMDGDGSFSVGKTRRSHSVNHYPVIQIGSLHESFIDIFVKIFGGTKHTKKASIGKDGVNRKDFTHWRLTNSPKCLPALLYLSPFLIGKKDRAKLLIDYIEKNPSESGGKKLSMETCFRRERSYNKMHELNRFDPKKTSRTINFATKNSEDPSFWSYLSGLMDTDGYITISSRKNRYFRPFMGIHVTDLRMLNFIEENCIYGSVSLKKDKKCKNGFIYRWEVNRINEVISLIENIKPFCILKYKQYELMLKFLNEKRNYMGRDTVMPDSEVNFRRQCKENMSRLNAEIVDLYKSPLMGLNLLPGNAEDNKAEAAKAGTVNAVSEETPKGDAEL